jgi:hypothetical protein
MSSLQRPDMSEKTVTQIIVRDAQSMLATIPLKLSWTDADKARFCYAFEMIVNELVLTVEERDIAFETIKILRDRLRGLSVPDSPKTASTRERNRPSVSVRGMVGESPPMPKGLTKLRRGIWQWLSKHNDDVDEESPTARELETATGASKTVCAEVKNLYLSMRTVRTVRTIFED